MFVRQGSCRRITRLPRARLSVKTVTEYMAVVVVWRRTIPLESCVFTCHAEIEGPFVYEHAPVQEDCMVCHTPHGSVSDNLLVQTEPALCLNCHPLHFHAAVQSPDGAWPAVPADPTRSGVSTSDGFTMGFATKCTQCHNMVHGTDNPSQAGSSGGNTLTR